MTVSQIINIVLGVLAVLVSFISYYFYIKSIITKETAKAVERAEIEGKTGAEKLEIATAQVYALVPVFLKSIISREFTKQLIQQAFDKIEAYAKKQLDKKSK
ncbi:MAG: hypothetical protein RR348_06650 [Clostridia bacterium]